MNQSKIRKNKLINKEGLRFLYTNADQFINKRDDLIMFISDNEPDVMMITEVIPKNQVNPIHLSLLSIDGYELHVNFDPDAEHLGTAGIRGVAIYTKVDLEIVHVSFDADDFRDHCWIEILGQADQKLLCGCIYRSPTDGNQSAALVSTQKVTDLIRSAYKRNSNLIITGDFNLKGIDWKNECCQSNMKHLSLFIQTVQDCFMYQHITEPTRVREKQTSNILDLVLTTEEGMAQDFRYHPPLGKSDHLILTFNVSRKQERKRGYIPCTYLKKADYKIIKNNLNKIDWDSELDLPFEKSYEKFINILFLNINDFSSGKKEQKSKRNIYMTTEALRLKNTKARAWKRYTSNRTSYSRNVYIKCRNSLRNLTRYLRKRFELTLTSNISDKPKLFWKYANSRLKTKQTIPTLLKPNGNESVNDEDKANTLNEYFGSIFTKEDITQLPPITSKRNDNILSTIEITPDQVYNKLKNINPNKATSDDGLHPKFLRELSRPLAKPLSLLFNMSLKYGVHESWRKATVTAIFKKGSRHLPENYRPVSITSVISKLMEQLIRDHILDFLTTNNVLCENQHGFIPKRNCMTQLLLCMEDWSKMIENNESFDIIYTDFSKAFDSVAHERLLVKLQNVGITGNLLNWIRSFLKNRWQRVRVKGYFSKWIKVLSGIPQGSVLGPLLFIIFINDLPNSIKESICRLFADDCKLYHSVISSDENTLQKDLDLLEEWSRIWQLPFNYDKCKVMHVGRNNTCNQYFMGGHKLKVTKEEKDLGVIIDSDFKFHRHSGSAIKRSNQILGLIKKSFATRDERTISNLYKSLVRPHLEYGNIIWGPFHQADIKLVEQVQRRATKLVSTIKDLPYEERLRALKLPSLAHRRKRNDMIQLYKIMNNLIQIDQRMLFEPARVASTRGHRFKIAKGGATKLVRRNAFSQRVINQWNNLPSEIVESPTLLTFKSKLDKYWEGQEFISPF